MGLFSIFNRKENKSNEVDFPNPISQQNLPQIPEDTFIEKDKPLINSIDNGNHATSENGITILFLFLERNLEGKGYDDALVNPDNTHFEKNIEALKSDLEITIKKVKLFYEDFIKEIDFHINTRTRSGMVDIVEELNVKKDIAESHVKLIIEIESDAKNNRGAGQSVIISYTRGFRNGLAAISHHSIMKKDF